MAFPDDPRDLIVGMAFGDTQFQNPTGLTYEQISPGTDPDDPGPVLGHVRMERGRIGDSPQTSPTRITFAVRNENGEFSPRNVTGPRFGTLREGTPTRVSVDVGSGDVVLATAHALGFQPVTDGPDINPRVPITALGPLNRISRDQEIRSALSLTALNWINAGICHGWWPMETGSSQGITSSASGIADGPPVVVDGTVAGGASGPPGASGALDLSGGGSLQSELVVDAGSDLWAVSFSFRLVGAVTGSDPVLQLFVGDLLYAQVSVTDSVGAELSVALDDGTSTDTETAAVPSLDDGEWHWLRISMEDSGGNTVLAVRVDDAAAIPATTVSVDFDRPDAWVLSPAGDVAAACQLMHFLDGTPIIYAAHIGVPDEPTATRVARVLDAVGIARSLGTTDGAAMGVQPAATLATILRECEDAENGVLWDLRDGRVGFDITDELYNQTAAWELDFEDITDLLMRDDGRDTYNQITVSDPDGNLGVAEDRDGPVGSDTSTGIGPRPFPVTRNLYDPEDLRHHAGWLLRKGTIDQPRYIVVVDLFATPDLIAGYMAAATGSADIITSRITVTGAPEEDYGPDPLDLIVCGEVAEIGAERWQVQLYCEPYEPWNVRELNEDTDPDSNVFAGRWAEEDGTVLDEAIDADDTSFDVDPNGGTWTTDDDEFDTGLGVGLYVEVGGERMQVTDIADAGGGIYTFTVVRSVNGVVKSHSSGAPLKVVDAQIWAL